MTTTTLDTIERARRYLAKVDPAVSGQRGHDQTYYAACVLVRRFGLSESEALALLREFNKRCQPPWAEAQLLHKVRSAMRTAGGQSSTSGMAAEPAWPTADQELRAKIVREGIKLPDLWEASPVRPEDNRPRAEELIDALFPGNPLLCVGYSPGSFATKPREEFRAPLARCPFITPSPMSAPTGVTLDGRISAHTLANTGPRKFLVVEFDEGSLDEHAALLWHLADFGPLTLAVHSGGKSLHGWFAVKNATEERLLRFFRYAASLGADPSTWTRSQFVRMPDGTRKGGQRQAVFYFNPATLNAKGQP
jgi:hypothetical protein